MKRLAWIAAIAAALSIGTTQASAADYKFKIFGGMSYVSPLSDSSIEGVGDSIEAKSELGYEVGLEWKPFNRFGFELSYVDATHDVDVDGTTVGEIGLQPLNLTLNWHVINGETFNWYLGPTVAFINWDDLELLDGSSQSVDSENTFGISTGVDIGIGPHFAVIGGLRWLDASVESEGDELSVDPLFIRLGVAWRF